MRNIRSVLIIASLLPMGSLAACGGDGNSTTGTQAKKAGPKDPKKLTKKPTDATSKGKASKVTAPGDTSSPSLSVPGGGEAELFAWQTDLTDSGDLSDCVGAFTSDGSAAIACAPVYDTCDDGSDLNAVLLLYFDASQDAGAFALGGSDLCGEGFDIIACDFDGAGNIGTCGTGEIVDDHIDVTP